MLELDVGLRNMATFSDSNNNQQPTTKQDPGAGLQQQQQQRLTLSDVCRQMRENGLAAQLGSLGRRHVNTFAAAETQRDGDDNNDDDDDAPKRQASTNDHASLVDVREFLACGMHRLRWSAAFSGEKLYFASGTSFSPAHAQVHPGTSGSGSGVDALWIRDSDFAGLEYLTRRFILSCVCLSSTQSIQRVQIHLHSYTLSAYVRNQQMLTDWWGGQITSFADQAAKQLCVVRVLKYSVVHSCVPCGVSATTSSATGTAPLPVTERAASQSWACSPIPHTMTSVRTPRLDKATPTRLCWLCSVLQPAAATELARKAPRQRRPGVTRTVEPQRSCWKPHWPPTPQ